MIYLVNYTTNTKESENSENEFKKWELRSTWMNGNILYPPRSGKLHVPTLNYKLQGYYVNMTGGNDLHTLEFLHNEAMTSCFESRTVVSCGFSRSALSIESIEKVDNGYIITTCSREAER